MKGTWRQEQARQAMLDGLRADDGRPEAEVISNAARDAVEVATTVKLTDDIIAATGLQPRLAAVAVLTAGFEAAGFEVIA